MRGARASFPVCTMQGGVTVLHDCVDRKPCLLIGGGEGIAALVTGDERDYEDRAKLLQLDGVKGEVESMLAGDFDNNGLTDLFLTFDHAPARMLLGQRFLDPGGEDTERMEYLGFQDATAGSGLEALEGPARGAIALDADGDGRLDLYIVEYGDTSKTGPSLRRTQRRGEPAVPQRDRARPSHALRGREPRLGNGRHGLGPRSSRRGLRRRRAHGPLRDERLRSRRPLPQRHAQGAARSASRTRAVAPASRTKAARARAGATSMGTATWIST
jgi:hypothetical protein